MRGIYKQKPPSPKGKPTVLDRPMGGSASTGLPVTPNEIGKLTSDHLQNPKQNFALNQTSSHSYNPLCNWSFSEKVLLDATEVHKNS